MSSSDICLVCVCSAPLLAAELAIHKGRMPCRRSLDTAQRFDTVCRLMDDALWLPTSGAYRQYRPAPLNVAVAKLVLEKRVCLCHAPARVLSFKVH